MKVKAKNNIKYNGKWVNSGDMFDVAEKDLESIAEYVDDLTNKSNGEFVSEIFPSTEYVAKEPPKRGRRKKSDD